MPSDPKATYDCIFRDIDYLIETGENADDIFDQIVDHFAYQAEMAQREARVYTDLLNKVRKNDPVGSVEDTAAEAAKTIDKYAESMSDLVSSLNDPKKGIMLETPNDLSSFINSYRFPNE